MLVITAQNAGNFKKYAKKRAVKDRSVLKRFYIISLLCPELHL